MTVYRRTESFVGVILVSPSSLSPHANVTPGNCKTKLLLRARHEVQYDVAPFKELLKNAYPVPRAVLGALRGPIGNHSINVSVSDGTREAKCFSVGSALLGR